MTLIRPLGGLLVVLMVLTIMVVPWQQLPGATNNLSHQVLTAATVTTTNNLVTTSWTRGLVTGWYYFVVWVKYALQTIRDRWLAWWQDKSQTVTTTSRVVIRQGTSTVAVDLTPQVQALIKSEIERQLAEQNGASPASATSTTTAPTNNTNPSPSQTLPPDGGPPDQGLVVVPAPDGVTSEDLQQAIQQSFSDPVSVTFDSSGRSGEIVPLFNQTTNRHYLFVLTPLSTQ